MIIGKLELQSTGSRLLLRIDFIDERQFIVNIADLDQPGPLQENVKEMLMQTLMVGLGGRSRRKGEVRIG